MTSTARASGKARKSQVARYQMYIDGRFVDAKSGKTFEVYDPSTEDAIATVPGRQRRRRRPGGAGGHQGLLRWLEGGHRPGARPDPPPAGRADPGPPGGAGGAGDPKHGQADRRVRVRHGRHRHLLRVLRRPRHQDQRRGAPRPGRRGRLCHAGADGRGRSDHPLELSAHDGRLEDRAGARGRVHGGPQAGGTDAALHPRAGQGLRGGGSAAWCGEHRHRRWTGRRRTDRGSSCHPEDRLHRQRRGRQDHHAECRRPVEAGVARAGRQVAQHLLQRRRLRERGGRSPVRHLHQSGRGLLGGKPGAGTAGHLQEVRGCRRREGENDQARSRHGPRQQDGSPGERRAARPGGQLSPGGAWRSEGGRGRRQAQAVRARAGTSSRRSSTTWTTRPGSRRRRSSVR